MFAPLLIRRVATSLLSYSAAREGIQCSLRVRVWNQGKTDWRLRSVLGWRECVLGEVSRYTEYR
jgi:hypothetical protein